MPAANHSLAQHELPARPLLRRLHAIRTQDVDEQALVERAREGDLDAVAELYRRNRTRLLAVCSNIVGHHEAEDALHNAMLDLPHRLRSFDPARGPFRPWLGTVVRNEALRSLRKRPELLGTDDDLDHDMPARNDDPYDHAWVREMKESLREGYSRLPRRQAEVLGLSLTMSDHEIAQQLGIADKTVRSTKHKARAKLAKVIDLELWAA